MDYWNYLFVGMADTRVLLFWPRTVDLAVGGSVLLPHRHFAWFLCVV